MQDADGTEAAAKEFDENALLWPHHDQSEEEAAPDAPLDRLDPTVPHAEEFDFTFQEMLQAAADEEDEQLSAYHERLCESSGLCESLSPALTAVLGVPQLKSRR